MAPRPRKTYRPRLPTPRLTMATPKPFPQAGFLRQLEVLGESAHWGTAAPLSPPLARLLLAADGSAAPTPAAFHLIGLLQARRATLQAAFDTELAAAALRQHQKFARPGQPSPHIVQLRQKQAAARQASSVSRQAFVAAAAAFVREAGIAVPPRVALELYVTRWIDANVPTDVVPAA